MIVALTADTRPLVQPVVRPHFCTAMLTAALTGVLPGMPYPAVLVALDTSPVMTAMAASISLLVPPKRIGSNLDRLATASPRFVLQLVS